MEDARPWWWAEFAMGTYGGNNSSRPMMFWHRVVPGNTELNLAFLPVLSSLTFFGRKSEVFSQIRWPRFEGGNLRT